MILLILLGLYSILAGARSQYTSTDGRNWSTIEEENLGGIAMRLKLLETPSLADQEWISLEFENLGGEVIPIRDAFYEIRYQIYDKKGGKLLREARLSSRSPAEIIDGAFASPVPVVGLTPGHNQSARFPSTFGASLLGFPKNGPLYVEALASVTVKLSKLESLNFKWENLTFDFLWHQPPATTLPVLTQRLNQLLAKPEFAPYHHHDLYTLLSIPQLSKQVSSDQLITALEKRQGKEDGRHAILFHLNDQHADTEVVLDFYLQKLREKDLTALIDLAEAADIWDNRFLEPLIALYQEANTGIMFRVMDVLYAHQKDWKNQEGISSILSDLLLYKYEEIIYNTPEQLDASDLLIWSSAISMLGKTGNPEVIPLLCPFMQCQTVVLADELQEDRGSMELPRARRVCDNALEALLRLEGKDLLKAYRKAGYAPPYENGEGDIIIGRIRDEMIRTALRKKRVCR